ncbi:MAG TPA: class I SAM-dependent methyltransferase [Vicinamibacterales bacterium]|nr:class I SAM-dependent methyltransferase [Vicinamibacterales bacterium]
MTAPGDAADAYHAVHLPEDPARARVWQAIADHLAPWVPASSHVLEIGAGYCAWINAVRAARKVAVDRWPDVARHAAPDVQTAVLDASTELRMLGSGTFDVVLASNVLEHFDPDTAARVVADVHTLLRFGGRFLVIQPNFRYAWRRYFDDYTHRSIFTDVSLPNLMRARGFEIDRVQPRFLPYSMRNRRVPATWWTVRAYLASPIKPRAGQMLVVARKG